MNRNSKLPRGAQARRALTLLEMMIVISISAVLAGIAASLFDVTFSTYSRNRESFEDMQILDQLSEQFRRDARAASSAELAGKPGTPAEIEFIFGPQERVTYASQEPDASGEASACELHRTRYRGDSVLARETYTLQTFGGPRFAVDKPADKPQAAENGSTPFVRLTLERRPPGVRPEHQRSSSPRELTIESAVGRDRRFTAGGPDS